MSISLVTGDLPIHHLIRAGYAAWGRGDMRPLFALATEDCELTIIGNPALNPGSGTWIGRAGIAQAFALIRSEMILRDITIESLAVTESRAFVHRHTTHEIVRTGRIHESQFVDVLDLDDGRIIRVQIFYDSATMALMTGQARISTLLARHAGDSRATTTG